MLRTVARMHAPAGAVISLTSFDSFPPGEALGAPAPVHILHSKISPQPLWNVERTSVENRDEKNPSTEPVDKFFFSTFALWRKKRWLPNEKWTFPHNFVLRLLRLKKL